MSGEPLTITIPEPLARKVRAAAAARGLSFEDYVIRVLTMALERDRAKRDA